MASSVNITNEKSSVFDDVAHDPDLEVRLYAEIYYTNENYQQDFNLSVDNTATLDTNLTSLPTTSAADQPNCVRGNKENLEKTTNKGDKADKVVDNSTDFTSSHPLRSWVFGGTSKNASFSDFQQRSLAQKVSKRQRWLTRKDLWLPRDKSQDNRHFDKVASKNNKDLSLERQFIEAANFMQFANYQNKTANASTRFETRSIQAENVTPVVIHSDEPVTDFTRFGTSLVDVENITSTEAETCTRFVTVSTNCSRREKLITDDIIRRDCSRLLEKFPVAKKISKKRAKIERERQKLLSMRKKVRAEKNLPKGLNADTSKYTVVSKKKKLSMKQLETEPVDISSDSDDSILEVPVPPKAPPPVIQLQDSDDDCQKLKKSRLKKHKKSAEECVEKSMPCYSHETDSSKDDEASVALTRDVSPTNIQATLPEAAKKTKNSEISVAVTNIQRQDCDDNCGKSSKSRSKKCKKPVEESREESTICYNLGTDSSKDDETSAAPISEASQTNLQKILKDAAKKGKNTEISAAIYSPEDSNLILNCTEIQKRAANLDEIKKIRESVSHAHSDDSMTESEATNWINIAAGHSSSSRGDEEISSIDSTIDRYRPRDPLNTASWNQSTQGYRASTVNFCSEIAAGSGEVISPIQTVAKSTGKNLNIPLTNSEVANARKRQKDAASSTFKDFDVPAIPEKRIKQNRQKTSKEQSMTEYFFKPMSSELQAFYNNPSGSENEDIFDIQSRMPRNPNFWAILDTDLQGSPSRRRRLCPRCKTDSHIGKRCPEKAKAPCCYMCGAKGHTESRCPLTMCLTCGRKYATYRPTCGYCSNLYCTICNGAGHSCDSCPDLWRRYHNTTTGTMPIMPKNNIMKPTNNLTCCNCAKRGHDVTMCRQYRWSQHYPTPIFISSYTEGPTYESSNRDRAQDTWRDNDFTCELPYNDEIYDVETSSHRIYDKSHDESVKETNPSDSIEIIEIEDDTQPLDETLPQDDTPPLLPVPQTSDRVVFQVGELDREKTIGWQKTTKRLDTMKNVHLTGLLSGHLKPTFLNAWKTYFDFGVQIIHDIVTGVFMIIQCRNLTNFKSFERVIRQWLVRSDAEKAYLVYDELSYENTDALVRVLRPKLIQLRSVLQPVQLLSKITSCDITLKRTNANLKRGVTKKNKRRLSSLKSVSSFSISRRCQLVTSLYSGSWVEGGQKIVQQFRKLAHHNSLKLGRQLSVRDYLQLVYLYNEIFTFYETEALRRALEKAVAVSPPSSTDTLTYPSAVIIGNNDGVGETDTREIQNLRIPEKSNFLGSSMDEQQLSNALEDSVTDSLQILTNSGADCTSNAIPQSSNEPWNINACDSNNYYEVPILDEEDEIQSPKGKIKRSKIKTGLLRNLTSKRRKLYRRAARDLIKKATSSDVSRLREMAKILNMKLDNLTIRTDDIQELQCALKVNLGCKCVINGHSNRKNEPKKLFKGTRKIRKPDASQNSDKAYVKFLRTL